MQSREQYEARAELLRWINDERVFYADRKYNAARMESLQEDMKLVGLLDMGQWFQFLTNYLSRAQTLGLDTPSGRQTFGKFIVTALNCLETAILIYGPMPAAGHPSGEIV